MITYPFASGIMVKHLEPRCMCRDCTVDSAALRCVGVSYCQSNCDFAYCPDAMQKMDSEMSEQGDECKPVLISRNFSCSDFEKFCQERL